MALKCVHQGCGKDFSDPTEKCEYHPGPPIFHEGQKGKEQQTFPELDPATGGIYSTRAAALGF